MLFYNKIISREQKKISINILNSHLFLSIRFSVVEGYVNMGKNQCVRRVNVSYLEQVMFAIYCNKVNLRAGASPKFTSSNRALGYKFGSGSSVMNVGFRAGTGSNFSGSGRARALGCGLGSGSGLPNFGLKPVGLWKYLF